MIKKWQIGDQIHDHNRGGVQDHPEASRGGGLTRTTETYVFCQKSDPTKRTLTITATSKTSASAGFTTQKFLLPSALVQLCVALSGSPAA